MKERKWGEVWLIKFKVLWGPGMLLRGLCGVFLGVDIFGAANSVRNAFVSVLEQITWMFQYIIFELS